MTVRVLCLGNELVRDDGVGLRVGRILAALELPAGVRVELRRCLGMELLEQLAPDEDLVLVDATRTGAPAGACRVLTHDDVSSLALPPFCSHGVGLSEVLAVAARLTPERLPRRLVLVGVEAEVLDRYGTALSDPVRDAIPRAVDAVLEALGAPDALRRQGVALAEQRKGWDPGPDELARDLGQAEPTDAE